jgi:hypothetical protein
MRLKYRVLLEKSAIDRLFFGYIYEIAQLTLTQWQTVFVRLRIVCFQ